jgi:RNA polymerase sigma-70 factor (ECF subfamily)
MNTATNSFNNAGSNRRANSATPRRPQRAARHFSAASPSPTEAQTVPANGKALKPDSASLNEVIRRAQQGDAEAFETIYRLHSQRVYALCLRMLGNPAEAEDLAQEAFLQLFRKIHTFRGESAFSSWLHRLTANVVLMSFRKKRPLATSLDEVTRSDEESDMPRKEIGVLDLHLSGVFDRVNLQAAIAQLPEGYKSMFILHDLHGYEHNEIAEILGCSVGNSKSQLHKARKRLRELLHRVQHYRPQHAREAAGNSLAVAASY